MAVAMTAGTAAPLAYGQVTSTPALQTFDAIQVTATRVARSSQRVPAAITVIDAARLRTDSTGVNLSEALRGVPGVLARERQNYAQDLQISIRGFGARSTFGIRGLRLTLDGLPATMPDGQGQVSNFDLSAMGRVEVLRGPFSALHGNAAGGVIEAFTATGTDDPGTRLVFNAGGDRSMKAGVNVRGVQGSMDYNLDISRFRTDGYRDHSQARRDWFNTRLTWSLPGGGTLGLVANALRQPEAQDPLGLTAAQMQADPRQVVPAAIAFNTRKSLEHGQVGLIAELPFGAGHAFRMTAYAGQRRVRQFLAIPVGAQNNPLHGGGVVDLDSSFGGADARLAFETTLFDRALSWVIGASDERQRQHRLGFENFIGSQLGVRGKVRRDQDDDVRSASMYLQGTWSASSALELMLGLRRSRIAFVSNDHFVTAGNPDDSGRRTYSATTPVTGLSFQLSPGLNVYASYGQGFETPTFDELGYRPDGRSGLNLALDAAHTRSTEIGFKGALGASVQLQLAAFRADTDDELAVASNAGGRSTYQNAGRARRQGLEVALSVRGGAQWRHDFSATWLDASFRDGFLTCTGSPCPLPDTRVGAGAPIPGVPRATLDLSSEWDAGKGWYAGYAARYVGSMRVSNALPLKAAAYATLDLHGGYRFRGHKGSRLFVSFNNVFNRRYAGSVIVNESSGRFFEPAPGRQLLVGIDWQL